MDVQTPTKLSRNAPCPCGSGKKYKKCCEPKEQKKMEEEKRIVTPKLKNEFRDELRDPYAGISKAELVTRDQVVLLRELRFRVWCGEGDQGHIGGAIEGAKALRVDLLGLPKSPYKEECLRDLDEYIKQSEVKLANLGPARSMVLQLMALEELFAEPKEETRAEPEDEDDDELTIQDEQPGEDVNEDTDPREII